MSANTGIEWTDATWNPVTGCDNRYGFGYLADLPFLAVRRGRRAS